MLFFIRKLVKALSSRLTFLFLAHFRSKIFLKDFLNFFKRKSEFKRCIELSKYLSVLTKKTNEMIPIGGKIENYGSRRIS